MKKLASKLHMSDICLTIVRGPRWGFSVQTGYPHLFLLPRLLLGGC